MQGSDANETTSGNESGWMQDGDKMIEYATCERDRKERRDCDVGRVREQ